MCRISGNSTRNRASINQFISYRLHTVKNRKDHSSFVSNPVGPPVNETCSIWCHVTILWLSCDHHVVVMWPSYVWPSCGCHVTIMWLSCDHHTYDHHVAVMWPSCGCHVTIMWLSCDHRGAVMWPSCGCHVIILLLPDLAAQSAFFTRVVPWRTFR